MRLALVHEFRTRSKVLICTEAGAKGLNLQFCETVINYDLPWNPQRIEQRIGRCHRYSQQRDVTVVNFIARDNEAHQPDLRDPEPEARSLRQGARRLGHGAARAAHRRARARRVGAVARVRERPAQHLQPLAHARRGDARDRRAAGQDRRPAGRLREGVRADVADHRVALRRGCPQGLQAPARRAAGRSRCSSTATSPTWWTATCRPRRDRISAEQAGRVVFDVAPGADLCVESATAALRHRRRARPDRRASR